MATTEIIVIGASVQRNTWMYNNVIPGAEVAVRNQMFTRLRQQGDIAFRSYAAGGDELAEIQLQVTQALADLSAVPTAQKPNYLFHIHAGGNDVSGNGAWPWTQQLQDDFVNAYTQILEDITNAGFEVAVCELTYRGYSEDVLADGATNQDRAGLVNTNLVWPLIEQYSPNWWDSINGIPVLDVHRESYEAAVLNNYFAPAEVFLPNPQDTIHPGPNTGTPVLQQFYADTLASNANFPVDPLPAKRIFTINASDVAATVDSQLMNVNRIVGVDGTTGSRNGLIDINGNNYPTASLSWSGWSSAATTGAGVVDAQPSEFLPTARHFYAANTYMSVNSGLTANITIGLGAQFANRNVVATFTSGRAVGVERGVTNINSQGQLVTIEPDVLPRQIRTMNLVTDASGNISVDYSLAAGSGGFAGYMSTISLEVDETVTITGPTTVTVPEQSPNTFTYTIPNATNVSVLGTLPATIANQGGDQYLLTIDPDSLIDFDSGVTSGTLSISASNDLDNTSLMISVTVTNVNENVITSPGNLVVDIPEADGMVNETYPPIAAWINSTNATGNNISSFLVNGTLEDGNYTITFTLEDAESITQTLSLTTKLAPIVQLPTSVNVLSLVERTVRFTIENDDNLTITTTLGSISSVGNGLYDLVIPPLDIRLEPTATIVVRVDDGVNPLQAISVNVTVVEDNLQQIPDISGRVSIENSFYPDQQFYAYLGRDNPICLTVRMNSAVIDLRSANRFELIGADGVILVDTDIAEDVEIISASTATDPENRDIKVIKFLFPAEPQEGRFLPYSQQDLTLVAYDPLHPDGQVLIHAAGENKLRFTFLES